MISAFRAWLERRRIYNSALAFNRRHTHAADTGYWRCPTCGCGHKQVSDNRCSGRQYPACCGFPAGPRLDHKHATGL